MNDSIMRQYERWVREASEDPKITEELRAMAGKEEEINDRFYRELAFGTGGLRGVMGAGTNRMNIYTVAKASQGLADYVRNQSGCRGTEAVEKASEGTGSEGKTKLPRIVVSYDSRLNSAQFARKACQVFAANGIEAYLFPRLMPTPCLSFAVRSLHCSAGVMITASHNPSKYNGYKVYGPDGCQITTRAAKAILEEIQKLDLFQDIRQADFEAGIQKGMIRSIPEEVYRDYVEAVKSQSVLYGKKVDRSAVIVYSPLNGTGLQPVTDTLKEAGYTKVFVVKEQEKPDGTFPTCPYPNPEIPEAMELGIQEAKRLEAEMFLATDPDCDRVGAAVKNCQGEYTLLSGNETGMLLLDYLCARRLEAGTMPEDPVCMKTIVTIDMAERIAAHYGVRTINVLTGFKYIGEQIGLLEAEGKEDSFIFGLEESCGYLSGTYVRDKDGVNAVFLICEMFAYYKTQGISLLDRLEELYRQYGYCLNTLHSYEFQGQTGADRMERIMEKFRGGIKTMGGKSVKTCLDYAQGLKGLPRSNVLKFVLEDHCSAVIRPSGTEPKMKVYFSVSAEGREKAEELEREMAKDVQAMVVGRE